MSEPAKPFACGMPDCGMTFTNEDHLHVHTKKHDMVLQLGLEQKAAFVADQTPTPTRFIRNCEEVGLFQDLQNVAANPFDEGFKRAMDAKSGILSLETAIAQSSDDVLHTPQMVFPLLEGGDPALFNTQRNITISRSSSDESGTIKEFETRTISKLTNNVSNINRIVSNDEVTIKQTDIQKDIQTVCYKKNFIRIESDVVKKDNSNTSSCRVDWKATGNSKEPVLVYTDSVIKETLTKDIVVDNTKLLPEKLPIMSQKSIDFVVDSLTSEAELTNSSQNMVKSKNDVVNEVNKTNGQVVITKVLKRDLMKHKNNFQPRILPKQVKTNEDKVKTDLNMDYEVVIKLPDGKRVKMKPVNEPDPKEVIRNRITKKISKPKILLNKITKPTPNVVKIPTGTLIPVTLVNLTGTPLTNNDLHNVPITKINRVSKIGNIRLPVPPLIKTTKRKERSKVVEMNRMEILQTKEPEFSSVELTITNKFIDEKSPESQNEVICLTEEIINNQIQENNKNLENQDDDCIVVEDVTLNTKAARIERTELERRSAASKRYRDRLKQTMRKQVEENRHLREANQRLIAEKAVLKLLITEHMKQCPNAGDIAARLTTLTNGGTL